MKNREYILIGKGLGFQKKKGMKADIDKVEKKFISDEKVEKIVNCVDISDNEKKLLNIVV